MRKTSQARHGAILPLTVLLLLVLLAFAALAIDVGMIALARNQCQNAADAAAVAGARTLNGDLYANYNLSQAPKRAVTAAIANQVLGRPISGDSENLVANNTGDVFQSGDVKIEIGSYAYYYSDDSPAPATEGFQLDIPRKRNADPWSAVRATVVANEIPTIFGRIFGVNSFSVTTIATAVHRPRDVVIIVDMSGSMRFQSLPATPMSGSNASPSSQSSARTRSLNPETVFPRFGHYSAVSSAALQGTTAYPTSGGEYVDPSNISTSTGAGPPVIEDFYANAAGAAPSAGNRAFQRKPDAQQTIPGGDNYWKTSNNTGTNFATTVQDITGSTSATANWSTTANASTGGYGSAFQGYTEGPGYWGKTFFIWPPDPRGSSLAATAANFANNGAKDWRQRFFIKVRTSNSSLGWLDHNSILWDTATRALKAPGTTTTVTENGSSVTYTYRINYAAIFHWLRNTGTNPFPSQLRAGRIRYYDAIPDPTDTGLNNRFWTTATLTNLNERFWKEYVDFVLGVRGTGAGTYTVTQNSVPITALIGNGDYYTWGTLRVSQKPDDTGATKRYMDYQDNPRRPRHQFWFGPMTFVDFIGNYNTNKFWWPGTCHEAQAWACKVGIQTAIQDIKNNHPNDCIALVYFSDPKYSRTDDGQHNCAKVAMGRSYQQLIDSLWFPPSTVTGTATEISPYDADMGEVPRAKGGTAPAMGFMLAYNQLSSSASNLRTYSTPQPRYRGSAGGLGRKGSQKLVIFETDGAPNTLAGATLQGSGTNRYYPIRIKDPGNVGSSSNVEWPSNSGNLDSQLYGVVDQICAKESAGGFSTDRKPVYIHCIAYGTLYDPANAGPDQTDALRWFQEIQYRGKTQSSPASPLADYKKIYGSSQQRIDRMRQAFTTIMQDGVQVSLIQ